MDSAMYGPFGAVPSRGYLPDRGCNSSSWRQPGPLRGSRSEHAADRGNMERRSIRGRSGHAAGSTTQASKGSVDDKATAAAVSPIAIDESSKGDGGNEEPLLVTGRYRRRARVPRRGRLTGKNEDDTESALVSSYYMLYTFITCSYSNS